MKKSCLLGLGLLLAGGLAWAQQYVISTVAGTANPHLPAPALSLSIGDPIGVAVDATGSVYFSTNSNVVLKVDPSGLLTRLAGNWTTGNGGDGGPATSAQLSAPMGLAVDAAGNVYIADSGNNVIRKVAVNGSITTVAGAGAPGYFGDGGPATSALLRYPQGVAADAAGNLYIADTGNKLIRKVATDGTITTAWGAGLPASQQLPASDVVVDGAGNLYVSSVYPSIVVKVAPGGSATTLASSLGGGIIPYVGLALDAAGNLYIAAPHGGGIWKVASDGTATTEAVGVPLVTPVGVAVDSTGNVFIADAWGEVVLKVAPGGATTREAGNGGIGSGDGGPATSAQLVSPYGVAVDAAGNLYIADSQDNSVRKVAANGTIATVAGNGTADYSGDGQPATQAELQYPGGVAVDAAGNLYIADTQNNRIRKVGTNGLIATVAGNGICGHGGDGSPAVSAQLCQPDDVAVDSAGNLYITDGAFIRKVSTGGTITTVAGDGTCGYSGDNGPATSAEMCPFGLTVDAAGNIYIADGAPYDYPRDNGNGVIRKVGLDGTITTVAGNGTVGYSGDGGPATQAKLLSPQGVAVDAAGNLYIADSGNCRVRKVTTDGNIATVGGNGTCGYSGDGGPATGAMLGFLQGIALDSAGNVYVADRDNNVIRLLVPAAARAVLSVSLTRSGGLTRGQNGATYTIAVSNAAGAAATSGLVTATDILPAGLALVSMTGAGWNCSSTTCTRSDALSGGSSYSSITLTVNVAADAPPVVMDQVNVSGGGSAEATASDTTSMIVAPATPVLSSPANGTTVPLAPTLTWNASSGATSYDVYFGMPSSPSLVTTTTGTSYAPGTLSAEATYYWQIVARNSAGTASSATWSFTTGDPVGALRFVPVTPCRAVDTRSPNGPFGGPTLGLNVTRSFAIPQSGCGIPSTAQAYSLNVTVVPLGPLYYLTLWPTGQPQAGVSTLNSWDGNVVANAAIVPAGAGGAVSVYVPDATDVILDVNGYFDSPGVPNSYSFYPATPCRVADTRGAAGTFGGPEMYGGQSRDFPIPLSGCGIPPTATAYSLNVTVVPDAVVKYLGYLTLWPTGQAQANVSTLNSWTGKVVANAALVPAGTNESISVYVPNPTDVILDINGYFGLPGHPGGLFFYPVTPCRVADTRYPAGPFGGPEMTAGETRSFPIPASGCGIPATAAAYSMNVTVVPDSVLYYLSAWPAGSPPPVASTLNSWDGLVVANAAIVPAGTSGAISIYVTNQTQVILDIDGYFAP